MGLGLWILLWECEVGESKDRCRLVWGIVVGGGNKVFLGIFFFGVCVGLGKDLKEKWGVLEEGGERSEWEGGVLVGGFLEGVWVFFGEKNRIEKICWYLNF